MFRFYLKNRDINIDVHITQRRNDMLGNGKRVFFQTRVDEDLLRKFRVIQEKEGRTARSLIEDYFYQKIEEDSKRRGKRNERWHTEL